MKKLNLFVPITKVDAAQRLVYGVATAEQPDIAKEVCDYATTKPYYETWSQGFAKVTDGKSLGNLRAMHGKVAAGKLTSIAFNDDDKQIEICAKVVDDDEWRKVEEGVYTGFSQGGRYVKRWKDGEITKYTAEPIEVSLVDIPCLPSATFQVIKADGATEMRKFKGGEQPVAAPISNEVVAARATELAKTAGDETKWSEFIAAARSELEAAALAKTAEADKTAGGDVAPEPKPGDDVAKAAIEGAEQVWQHPSLPGQTFKKKAELRTALDASAAKAAAATAAGPVLDKLAAISAELDKRDGGPAPEPAAAEPPAATGAPAAKAAAIELPVVESVDQLKAAVAGFDKAGHQLATRRHLVKRAIALNAVAELPAGWFAKIEQTDELKKGISLWSIANLLQLLSSVESCEEACEYFDQWPGAVNLPKDMRDKFGALVVELGDLVAGMLQLILATMREKEAAEAMEQAAPILGLMKAGARHSSSDMQLLNSIHDHAVALGADCGDDDAADKTAPVQDLAKAAGDLAKITAERDALSKALDELGPKLDDVLKRVKNIEAQPMPGGPARTHAVLKHQDGSAGPGGSADDLVEQLSKLSPDQQIEAMIKVAQRTGLSAPHVGR